MRILLADHQSRVRFALRALLAQRPELRIVGEAVDAEDLLTQARVARPDLILLDWGLQGLAATDLVFALRKVCPDVHVIVLSGRPEARQATLEAGADAFVSKTDSPERLLVIIDHYWHTNHGVEG